MPRPARRGSATGYDGGPIDRPTARRRDRRPGRRADARRAAARPPALRSLSRRRGARRPPQPTPPRRSSASVARGVAFAVAIARRRRGHRRRRWRAVVTAGLVVLAGADRPGRRLRPAGRRRRDASWPPGGGSWSPSSLAVAAIALGQLGLWLFARIEGGVLPLVDYLGEVFGPSSRSSSWPPSSPRAGRPMTEPDEFRLRRPAEADHARLVGQVDDWWGGRNMHELLPRLWFQHFTGTSWVAEDERDRPVGFLVGFVSPDRPGEAYIHMIGMSPNHRRRGLGPDALRAVPRRRRGRGASAGSTRSPGRATAVSVAFHRALGFVAAVGPGHAEPVRHAGLPGLRLRRRRPGRFSRQSR